MNAILEVKGLCKEFRDFSLKDVSFSLPQGYIMGFIGQNGAGKTTTIKLILNMMRRSAGEIRIFGRDNIENEAQLKQHIGVVFDSPYYVEDWRLSDVESAVSGFYQDWDSALFAKYRKDFGLSADKRVKDLSRGMKMKLMVAVALSHRARLLILDEPTSGLDPVARDELLSILYDYIAGGDKSVLFSTHITADLEKIADYITFIQDGSILYTGTKDELLESYQIVKGGIADITAEQRRKIIGLRESSIGFEGLAKAADLRSFSRSVCLETATLDDIIVYMNKGGARNV